MDHAHPQLLLSKKPMPPSRVSGSRSGRAGVTIPKSTAHNATQILASLGHPLHQHSNELQGHSQFDLVRGMRSAEAPSAAMTARHERMGGNNMGPDYGAGSASSARQLMKQEAEFDKVRQSLWAELSAPKGSANVPISERDQQRSLRKSKQQYAAMIASRPNNADVVSKVSATGSRWSNLELAVASPVSNNTATTTGLDSRRRRQNGSGGGSSSRGGMELDARTRFGMRFPYYVPPQTSKSLSSGAVISPRVDSGMRQHRASCDREAGATRRGHPSPGQQQPRIEPYMTSFLDDGVPYDRRGISRGAHPTTGGYCDHGYEEEPTPATKSQVDDQDDQHELLVGGEEGGGGVDSSQGRDAEWRACSSAAEALRAQRTPSADLDGRGVVVEGENTGAIDEPVELVAGGELAVAAHLEELRASLRRTRYSPDGNRVRTCFSALSAVANVSSRQAKEVLELVAAELRAAVYSERHVSLVVGPGCGSPSKNAGGKQQTTHPSWESTPPSAHQFGYLSQQGAYTAATSKAKARSQAAQLSSPRGGGDLVAPQLSVEQRKPYFALFSESEARVTELSNQLKRAEERIAILAEMASVRIGRRVTDEDVAQERPQLFGPGGSEADKAALETQRDQIRTLKKKIAHLTHEVLFLRAQGDDMHRALTECYDRIFEMARQERGGAVLTSKEKKLEVLIKQSVDDMIGILQMPFETAGQTGAAKETSGTYAGGSSGVEVGGGGGLLTEGDSTFPDAAHEEGGAVVFHSDHDAPSSTAVSTGQQHGDRRTDHLAESVD